MDDIDRAQHHTEQHLQHILQAHANRIRPASSPAKVCEECGDEIPMIRRRMAPGCTRCVSCQREVDKAPPA